MLWSIKERDGQMTMFGLGCKMVNKAGTVGAVIIERVSG